MAAATAEGAVARGAEAEAASTKGAAAQQAIMLAEFQTENATLEVRLWNIGTEKPMASVTESGRLLTHVASMQRRATMNAEAFSPIAAESGDLDGDPERLDEDQDDSHLIVISLQVQEMSSEVELK